MISIQLQEQLLSIVNTIILTDRARPQEIFDLLSNYLDVNHPSFNPYVLWSETT